MSSIADWADFMPSTITHRGVTSLDQFAAPATFAAPVVYKARITQNPTRIASRQTGEEVIANTTVWINGIIPNITAADQITLPDGSTPLLVDWDIVQDETGDHHMKLYLGGIHGRGF
jgi:hypothetical protein